MISPSFEHTTPSDRGTPDIAGLADAWAAMAVQEVLEPDLDDLLKRHLEPREPLVVRNPGSKACRAT